MAQGSYEHPAYLSRVLIQMDRNTAGANGTSGGQIMPWACRLHGATALVVAAGTSTGSGARVEILVGTASVGMVALGTSTIGAVVNSGLTDMNALVPEGTPIYLKNGTDATAVACVSIDATIDAATGDWNG